MKKKFLIIFSAIFTMSLFSCDNFLDRYPKEELSSGSFWKTIEDAERFTGNMYPTTSYGLAMGDNATDDIVPGIKWMDSANEAQGIYDPGSYGWGYGTVRQASLCLENIDGVPGATEEQKAIIKAEARFFRANFYAGMVQGYGAVPYIDKTLGLDELKVPRSPVAEIYPKIVEDFEYAFNNLRLTESGSRLGRLTKGAALTALADCQMYLAGFPEYQSFVTYADAAATAKRVIDLGVYGLWDEGGVQGNYRDYFWGPGDVSNENILFTVYGATPYNSGLVTIEAICGVGWGGVNPTQSLVDAFEDSEGAPISKSKIYDPKEPWKNRDMRFSTNIGYHGALIDGVNQSGGWNFILNTTPGSTSGHKNEFQTGINMHNDATATGYYELKWMDRSVDCSHLISDGWYGTRDLNIYRFAEVLLWYAEALNEVSGPTAEVFQAINRIRARVRQPLLQNSDASKPTFVASKEEMRERIRNEYRVEMCFEGKRYSTIRRWRTADGKPLALKVMNEPIVGMPFDEATQTPFVGPNVIIPARPLGRRFEEHNLLYPIPSDEIDKNSNLTQNPGY